MPIRHDLFKISQVDLMDSQLNVDVLSNNKLLTNIRDVKKILTLYWGARKAIIPRKGDLKGYGTVWFYPDGIANILSLGNIQKVQGHK